LPDSGGHPARAGASVHSRLQASRPNCWRNKARVAQNHFSSQKSSDSLVVVQLKRHEHVVLERALRPTVQGFVSCTRSGLAGRSAVRIVFGLAWSGDVVFSRAHLCPATRTNRQTAERSRACVRPQLRIPLNGQASSTCGPHPALPRLGAGTHQRKGRVPTEAFPTRKRGEDSAYLMRTSGPRFPMRFAGPAMGMRSAWTAARRFVDPPIIMTQNRQRRQRGPEGQGHCRNQFGMLDPCEV